MMQTGYWVTALVTAAAIVLCVVLHYETLRLISQRLPLPNNRHRARIVSLILSLLALHITEIWIFGGSYFLLLSFGDHGSLSGIGNMSILDCIYYSASVFTTLGFGDIVPTGAIRFMTGTEAIAGLTFITWSASFTFLVMQKSWDFNGD